MGGAERARRDADLWCAVLGAQLVHAADGVCARGTAAVHRADREREDGQGAGGAGKPLCAVHGPARGPRPHRGVLWAGRLRRDGGGGGGEGHGGRGGGGIRSWRLFFFFFVVVVVPFLLYRLVVIFLLVVPFCVFRFLLRLLLRLLLQFLLLQGREC